MLQFRYANCIVDHASTLRLDSFGLQAALMDKRNRLYLILAGLLLVTLLLSAWVLFLYLQRSYSDAKLARLESCPSKFQMFGDSGLSSSFVLMGDSRAWEFGIWLERAGKRAFSNLAVPGETSFETYCKSKNRLPVSIGDKTLILSLGINDIVTASMTEPYKRGEIEKVAAENIISIATKMKHQFDRVVVFTVVPPIDTDYLRLAVWGSDISISVDKLNQKLRQGLPAGVVLLDLSDVFYDLEAGAWRSELARDALHWNEDAYEALHDKISSLVIN